MCYFFMIVILVLNGYVHAMTIYVQVAEYCTARLLPTLYHFLELRVPPPLHQLESALQFSTGL